MPRACLRPSGLALLALSACATVSSGIQPAGSPDTYTLTERESPVNGGARAAARDAAAEAQAFCAARHAAFVPLAAQPLGRPVQAELVGDTGVTLRFRCGGAASPDRAVPDLPPLE